MSKLTDILMFTGVGQAGGNIAKLFFGMEYGGFFVNSSKDDLDSLGVPTELTYHIPAGTGCAKSLEKAKQYGNTYGDRIITSRFEKFSQYLYNFYCFAGGGGTGCGLSPILIRKEKERKPETVIGAIVALPSSKDSSTSKKNAMKLIEELSMLLEEGILSNLWLFDNNKGDIFKVNEHIVARLCQLFSLTNSNERGVIDISEIENVLRVVGCVNVLDLTPQGDKFIVTPDAFIPKSARGCVRLAYSIKDDTMFAKEHVEEVFGRPEDYFKGYSVNGQSTVFSFGMLLPKEHLLQLQSEVVDEKKNSKPRPSFRFNFGEEEESEPTQPAYTPQPPVQQSATSNTPTTPAYFQQPVQQTSTQPTQATTPQAPYNAMNR